MKIIINSLKAFFGNIIEGDIKKADVLKDRSKLRAYRNQQSARINMLVFICFVVFAVSLTITVLR